MSIEEQAKEAIDLLHEEGWFDNFILFLLNEMPKADQLKAVKKFYSYIGPI